jgi:hypothetical protein
MTIDRSTDRRKSCGWRGRWKKAGIGIPKSGARWDCESAGLLVSPDDDVSVQIQGKAR